MPDMPPFFRRGGARQSPRETYERERGSARARGYDSRWEREAKVHLRAHPFCAYCALDDIVTAATLVDHLYPHRGDRALFWEWKWWVASCKPCHDGFKKSVERAGVAALNSLAARLGLEVRPHHPPGG